MRGHQTLDGPLLHPKAPNPDSNSEGRGTLLRCGSLDHSEEFKEVQWGS